ncbi:hypothetical protein [Mesorhizobium sp. M0500]|uniref:hypothetical protein n=1 Tax=Mesorhizobium sp. M0500 TaxID=2956953 RepID=UPI00333D4411
MASTDVQSLDSTLVEIVTEESLVGWGETCPVGPVYQPYHALGARAAIAEIAPGLVGLGGDVHLASTVEPRRFEGARIAQEYIDGHYDPDNPIAMRNGHIAVLQRPGLAVQQAKKLGGPNVTYGR